MHPKREAIKKNFQIEGGEGLAKPKILPMSHFAKSSQQNSKN